MSDQTPIRRVAGPTPLPRRAEQPRRGGKVRKALGLIVRSYDAPITRALDLGGGLVLERAREPGGFLIRDYSREGEVVHLSPESAARLLCGIVLMQNEDEIQEARNE